MISFSSVNFASIFLSTLISICVAVFLLDRLKTDWTELSLAIAEDIKHRANLPETISSYRVLRVLYMFSIFLITTFLHFSVYPIHSWVDAVTCMALSSVCIPIFTIVKSTVFNICWSILATIIDIISYFFWVPYYLYKDRDHPSIRQFTMFYSWVLFFILLFPLMFIFAQSISQNFMVNG